MLQSSRLKANHPKQQQHQQQNRQKQIRLMQGSQLGIMLPASFATCYNDLRPG